MRPGMGMRAALVLAASCSACASSPEVKQASAAMTLALAECDENVVLFQDLYTAEITKLQEDVGRALVNRIVAKEMEALGGTDASFDAMANELKDEGLVPLSERIEATTQAARKLVALLMEQAATVCQGVADCDPLSILKRRPAALRDSARALAAGKSEAELAALKPALDELEAQAAKLDLPSDPLAEGYMAAILEWGALKAEIPGDLQNLRNVIAAMQTTHKAVDAWVQTDVVPSGDQIGDLMKKHEGILGLAADSGKP